MSLLFYHLPHATACKLMSQQRCFAAAVSDKKVESCYKCTTMHPMKMEVKIGHLLSAYFVFDSINRMLFNAAIFFAPHIIC